MTTRESNESRFGGMLSERTVPVDMVGVCVAVILSAFVYYVVPLEPIRFLVSVPLLLFFPGYVFVGILFPRQGAVDQSPPNGSRSLATVRNLGHITLPERAALSLGLSIAFIPVYGFGLELLPVDVFDGAIMPTLGITVLFGALLASARRLRTPADERFRLPLETVATAVAAPFNGPMPRAERIATIVLAATVLLAVFSVGYVFAVPQQGEQFTDLRVMTESPDGELTLGNYPDTLTVDETSEFVIGVDNYEGQQQAYTVVIRGERIIEDDGSATPIETIEVGRFETTLDDGERITQSHTVTPGSTGEFRITYYLYKGTAPENPNTETAYRHVHFTTNVVESSGDSTASGNESASAVDEPATTDESPADTNSTATDEDDSADDESTTDDDDATTDDATTDDGSTTDDDDATTDDGSTTGDDDTTTGDDGSTTGDDDTTTDDGSTAGDDDTTTDDGSTIGDDDTTTGDDSTATTNESTTAGG